MKYEFQVCKRNEQPTDDRWKESVNMDTILDDEVVWAKRTDGDRTFVGGLVSGAPKVVGAPWVVARDKSHKEKTK